MNRYAQLAIAVVAIVAASPDYAQALAQSGGATYTDQQAYTQAQQAIADNLAAPIAMAGGSTVAGSPIASAATVPALAPVKSVNSQTGAVSVPVFFRQVGTCTPDGSGNCSWAFPTTFSTTPTCLSDVAGSASYTYSSVRTAISAMSVTYNVTAMPKVLTISLGSMTIWGLAPAGTSLTLSCFAPQ